MFLSLEYSVDVTCPDFSDISLSFLCVKRSSLYVWKCLFTGTVPVNKNYRTGTVPVNKNYPTGTVPVNKNYPTGTVPVNKNYPTGTLINKLTIFSSKTFLPVCLLTPNEFYFSQRSLLRNT